MTRTFIALEMNKAVQSQLVNVIHQLALALPSVRWVDPASIHLTLAFLGELDEGQLEEARQAALFAARQVNPFSYRLIGLNCFGPSQQPRVIWMGIEEVSGSLQRLHHLLKVDLERHGFEVEQRPFSPHLTLAHLKGPLKGDEQQRWQELLAARQVSTLREDTFAVHSIHVVKSELQRSGAHYTLLYNCALAQENK